MRNEEVVEKFIKHVGTEECKNHNNTLSVSNRKLYSYNYVLAYYTEDGLHIVKKRPMSMTTTRHYNIFMNSLRASNLASYAKEVEYAPH